MKLRSFVSMGPTEYDAPASSVEPNAEAIRTIGVTAFTYYRWRKEFGGLKSDQVKRLKDLEKEKQRLETEVENLRTFEREYRSRLRSYFTEQLAMLDGQGEGGKLPTTETEHTPKRLRSILGDEDQGGKAQG